MHFDLSSLKAIDDQLTKLGLPTYTNVACALCDVLDGESQYDIIDMVGQGKDEGLIVANIRDAASPVWKQVNGIR